MALTDTLAAMVGHYGIAGLFASVGLESLGLPLPGETAIVLSAGLAARGDLNILAVVIAAITAAIVGDNIGYLIGRRLGRPVILRYGGRVGITPAVFDRAEAIIRRRGALMVAAARFVVLLRQLNGLVAGTAGMPWRRFLIANIIGAAAWVGVWATVGYRLGAAVYLVPFLLRHLSLVAMIAIPLLILALLVLDLRRS